MLPLHGQGTAAVENNSTGQDGPIIYSIGGVFGKQAKIKFAEFLHDMLVLVM